MAKVTAKATAKTKIKAKTRAKKPDLKLVDDTNRPKVVVIDKTPGSPAHEHDVKILASCEEEIRKAGAAVGHGFYRIGEELLAVRKGDLYRVAGHASFDAWLKQFTAFSKQTAYNMMAVAKSLDKETATRLGPAIAYVVARASDQGARAELISLARKGASTSEIKDRARKQRAERGIVPKSPGRPVKEKRGARLPKGTAKRAVSVSNGAQKDMDDTAPRPVPRPTPGERGCVDLKEINAKKESALVAGGYTHRAVIEVGCAKVQLEINKDKGLLKYKVM